MDPKLQWTQNRKSITDNSKNFCQNFLWNFSILPAEKQTVVKNAFSTTDNWSPKDTLLLLILFNLIWYQDKLWKILENPVASDTCSHSSCDSLSSWTKRKEEAKNYNKSNVTFLHFISIELEFRLPMACVKCRLARVARVASRYWSDGCAISDCDAETAETGHNIITSWGSCQQSLDTGAWK